AKEAIFAKDDLTLTILVNQAIQTPMRPDSAPDVLKILREIIMSEFLKIEEKEAESFKNEGILEAVIVGNDGKIMASSSREKRIGETYFMPAGLEDVNEKRDFLVQEFEQKGKKYFDVAVPMVETISGRNIFVGKVHLKMSQSIIDRIVTTAAVKLVLITLLALITGIILSVMLVNFLVKPIGFLVKGVRAIGEGKYDVQIKIHTRDELGELTDAFNATAKSLKEKELLKGAFSTYVSNSVMEQVLNDPDKLKLHGTRVKATMLFTDIRGFTSMSEDLQPEDVVSVINEYLTLQTDKVFKWSGLLDKFVGDCVMAVYGVPFPKDDDAYRAVRTGMDIREGVERLNAIRKRRDQITVGIGIGINTGEVVSGNMGSPQKMDYTVIGDNVNLAARLEANAPAGSVWVSESTYKETYDRIEYEELESIMVKGKKDPVRIFSPIKIKDTELKP
ncbi:MAG TPA: adenylate/guanylate cyclase domain-containing protein, partial [Firmicutes bacterium]|nr:adenylate/guanylate cyclase domain-containing protein [Bacillota bacterium]